MIGIGTIGVKALYLLFAWLISAAAAAWLADRKGYAERVGLTLGLLLSVVGLLVMLFLPGRPGSKPRSTGQLGCFRACQRERCPLNWDDGSE